MAKKQTMAKKVAEKKVVAPKEQPKTEQTKVQPQPKAPQRIIVSDALIIYQNDTTINNNLTNDCLTEEQKQCVSRLDKAMTLLPDIELNRLVIMPVIEKYMAQAGVKTLKELEGKTIENVPYMSTTKNTLHDILEKRYRIGLNKPICIVVHTEGKAKGIDVVAKMKEEEFGGERMESQQEVILARQQKFLVKKVTMSDGWGEAYPILHFYAV